MTTTYKSYGGQLTGGQVVGGMAASLMALTLVSTSAIATDGYFAHGFGARHKALAGAGVADGRDATSGALNPAGLVHLERDEFSMSVTAFSPRRKYSQEGITRSAPFAGPLGPTSGTIVSDKNWFAIPNMAYAHLTSNNPYFDVIGFSVVGNGGMNTRYPASAGNGAGVFGGVNAPGGGAQAGINLEQAIISLSVAKKFGSLSVGLSPAIVRQQFRATGLEGFQGFTVPGQNIGDRGDDVSWGWGLRAGLEWEASDSIRFGIAGNTKYYMSPFDKYDGLFAQKGDFDIPASIQLGVAMDVMPTLTVMLDYKHIFYEGVASIANSSTNIRDCNSPFVGGTNPAACFGGESGPGFGWKDIDVIKVAAEWEATDALTLRAGYSYNTSPIPNKEVTLNILAPATVQHHITAGLEYEINDNWSIEMEGMYAPEVSIKGDHLFNGSPCFPFPDTPACNGTEEISMYQYEITAGIKYKFGAPEASPYK